MNPNTPCKNTYCSTVDINISKLNPRALDVYANAANRGSSFELNQMPALSEAAAAAGSATLRCLLWRTTASNISWLTKFKVKRRLTTKLSFTNCASPGRLGFILSAEEIWNN